MDDTRPRKATTARARREPDQIDLLGIALDRLTVAEAVDHIDAALERGEGGWVITPNLDILRRLVRDPEFAELCAAAEMRLADGMPLVWASRLQGTPLRARAPGSDLVVALAERAARSERSILLLGGSPGVAVRARAVLEARFPGIRVCGAICPPLGFERDAAYVSRLTERVVECRPDIVYVALGCPKQERLISALRPRMPATWLLGVGISLSFVTGEVRRAPALVRALGLEWIHRLAQEPGRLARRYIVHGLPFAVRLLWCSAWRRLVRRSATR